MAKVRLSLSVDDAHLNKIGKIAKAAASAGMDVEQRLEGIGVLTGSIEASKVGKLREIEGVSQVEEERAITLPTPGSNVQ